MVEMCIALYNSAMHIVKYYSIALYHSASCMLSSVERWHCNLQLVVAMRIALYNSAVQEVALQFAMDRCKRKLGSGRHQSR